MRRDRARGWSGGSSFSRSDFGDGDDASIAVYTLINQEDSILSLLSIILSSLLCLSYLYIPIVIEERYKFNE